MNRRVPRECHYSERGACGIDREKDIAAFTPDCIDSRRNIGRVGRIAELG
jgi:hypothetical protein